MVGNCFPKTNVHPFCKMQTDDLQINVRRRCCQTHILDFCVCVCVSLCVCIKQLLKQNTASHSASRPHVDLFFLFKKNKNKQQQNSKVKKKLRMTSTFLLLPAALQSDLIYARVPSYKQAFRSRSDFTKQKKGLWQNWATYFIFRNLKSHSKLKALMWITSPSARIIRAWRKSLPAKNK